jgi:hypothetical protein
MISDEGICSSYFKNAGIVVDSFNCGLNALIKQNESTRNMDLVITRNSSNDLMLMSVELE